MKNVYAQVLFFSPNSRCDSDEQAHLKATGKILDYMMILYLYLVCFIFSALYSVLPFHLGFPCSSVGKESACSAGTQLLIPGLGRSPGEGNGNPFQYSCLENPMDREGCWATVHGVTNSRTRLSKTHTRNKTKDGIHRYLRSGYIFQINMIRA